MKPPLHPDPEIAANRALALAELRKPESKRHAGELESVKDPCARCCLGHMTAALADKLSITRTVELWKDQRAKNVRYNAERSYIPHTACRALDMTRGGQFVDPQEAKTRSGVVERFGGLVAVNDCTNWRPKRMADFIEKQMRAGNFEPYRP